MRILWVSNAPWSPTGYGVQTAVNVPRIAALGHEMTILAFYGLQGASLNFGGIRVMPAGADPYGNDVIWADAEHVQADAIIIHADIWVFTRALGMEQVARRAFPWLPVDHDPAPPAVIGHVGMVRRPICYAQFGVQKLREAGCDPLYVPHSVDCEHYKPLDRVESKKRLGCPPDAFLVGIVAANKGAPSRKAFDTQIRAFAELRKRHPEAMLYLHTDFDGVFGGESIPRLLELNEVPPEAVARPSPYQYARGLLGVDYMRTMYSAFDVYLNAVMGGGFELGLIEAQACGTPVITTNFSAMPELVRAGWLVEPRDKFYTAQGSYQAIPDWEGIVAALEEAHKAQRNPEIRQRARQAMLDEYNADDVAERYWKPVLAEIERDLAGDTVQVPDAVRVLAQQPAQDAPGDQPDAAEQKDDPESQPDAPKDAPEQGPQPETAQV